MRLLLTLWIVVKAKFGGNHNDKVETADNKIFTHKKHPNHTIKQHLPEMPNMIKEMKLAQHALTDEQHPGDW